MRKLVRPPEELAEKSNILLTKEQSRREIMKQTPQNKMRTPRSMLMLAKYQQEIKENQHLLLPFPLAKFLVNPERNSILISSILYPSYECELTEKQAVSQNTRLQPFLFRKTLCQNEIIFYCESLEQSRSYSILRTSRFLIPSLYSKKSFLCVYYTFICKICNV